MTDIFGREKKVACSLKKHNINFSIFLVRQFLKLFDPIVGVTPIFVCDEISFFSFKFLTQN